MIEHVFDVRICFGVEEIRESISAFKGQELIWAYGHIPLRWCHRTEHYCPTSIPRTWPSRVKQIYYCKFIPHWL
jgi:hypothetical protein